METHFLTWFEEVEAPLAFRINRLFSKKGPTMSLFFFGFIDSEKSKTELKVKTV